MLNSFLLISSVLAWGIIKHPTRFFHPHFHDSLLYSETRHGHLRISAPHFSIKVMAIVSIATALILDLLCARTVESSMEPPHKVISMDVFQNIPVLEMTCFSKSISFIWALSLPPRLQLNLSCGWGALPFPNHKRIWRLEWYLINRKRTSSPPFITDITELLCVQGHTVPLKVDGSILSLPGVDMGVFLPAMMARVLSF